MNDNLLRVYHHLPAPLRSLAAGLKGLHIRSWRYGPETERLMEQAVEREHWNHEQWQRWKEERLGHLLHRAATRVPFYREQWEFRRRRGDKASWEYLENWPVLNKESLRQSSRAFVADDRDVRNMYYDHTSGTTGTPLNLWLNRETMRTWHALFEVRARRWNGVNRHENWATLGGQLVILPDKRNPPFWVWNAPMGQLYLSANHISRHNVPAYIGALNGYHVTHMLAYSSAVAALAREAVDLGLKVPKLRLIITIAEPITTNQRDVVREAFGCDVRESYGMSEMVTSATECSSGSLHLWPEIGSIEVLDNMEDAPVLPGITGRLIATGLLNTDMPLIRYALGDRGILKNSDARCPCGRSLPVLASVDGRVDDVLFTRDGRWVGRLDPVFKAKLPIHEAQIIQETLDTLRVRYVPAKNFTVEASHAIIDRLRDRMGPINVVMEPVNELPREANGKFRAVICRLTEKDRELLRKADR